MALLNKVKVFFKSIWNNVFKKEASKKKTRDKKYYLGIFKDAVLWTVIAVMFFVGTILVISVFDFPGGIKLFVIESNSMEPTLKVGSLVLIKDRKDYGEDDVITFNTPVSEGSYKTHDYTTHRIVNEEERKGISFFTTKGDNNKENDRLRIDEKSIKGKVIFHLPYAGYVIDFAKNTKGIIFIIIIPAAILMYRELSKLKDNAFYLYKKNRKEREENKKETEKSDNVVEEIETVTIDKITDEIIKDLSSS